MRLLVVWNDDSRMQFFHKLLAKIFKTVLRLYYKINILLWSEYIFANIKLLSIKFVILQIIQNENYINMKKKLNLLILFFATVLSIASLQTTLFAQLYKIEIKEITINNATVAMENQKDIVISSTDTIGFKYELQINTDKKTTQPFFYNAVLIHNDFKAPRTSGLSDIIYSNLGEGNYTFEVNAFDLGGSWISSFEKINFRVNNKEAGLMKKINELEQKLTVADSTIKNLEKIVAQSQTSNYNKLIIIATVSVAVVFVVLFFVFKSKSAKQKIKTEEYINKIKKYQKKSIELETKISNEQDENKKEVKKLKDNMDFMMKKFDDIFELNKNVSDDVLTISSKTNELTDLQTQKNGIFSDIVKGITDPTMVIKGLVDLLRNYDFNASETKDIVENIIDTTKKIINMSEDIQRFIGFVDTSEIMLDLDKTSAKEIVEKAVQQNINEAKKKNINILVNVASDIEPIKLDSQKIIVVLHNLIDNAVKFTGDRGSISINCYNKNNAIYFEVNDTGIGISQDDLKKIYKSMEENISSKYLLSNTTIGLLTVKKYVEAHNGKVMVSSIVGKGSTFSFNIPYRENRY